MLIAANERRDKGGNPITASDVIEKLQLEPHPEGGWYRETWRGPENGSGRAVGTAILFLLESHQSSHWHRVDAHELWLWQAGDPLRLLTCEDAASEVGEVLLGPDLNAGQQLQRVVDVGHWQAARPLARGIAVTGYTLVSCVVTPGFEFSGFELAPPGWEPG